MHPEASKVYLRSFFIFRGDIVIAKSPFDPDMNICKRVIGLEGDKVCTSGPSDLFKTHTYVSTETTRQAICISAVYPFLCKMYQAPPSPQSRRLLGERKQT